MAIAFQDLIGQPTWLDPATVQFKCALRADVAVGYIIKPPQGFYGVVPAGNIATPWNYRNQSAQQGTFTAIRVRQLGNFRAPDAGAWVTVIDAAFVPAQSSAANG